ncbi:MAG: hypothetical protein HYV45_02315, partial [Candidatus Moranbacteria bacterium]|nr:hypothetical protein [Candidatus Moranbacteria bacterium]
SAHSILYYVSRDDPRGQIPEKPSTDPQYKNWEKGVENWYEKKKGVVLKEPPKKECEVEDFSSFLPKISLSSSSDITSSSTTFTVSLDAPYGVDTVTYSFDGSVIGSTTAKPYSLSYDIPLEKNNSSVLLEVEVKDKNNNKTKTEKNLTIHF